MSIGRPTGLRRFWSFGLALFCGLFVLSCAAGSGGQGNDTCQPHGHAATDGSCLCDPGYSPDGKHCVSLLDGDLDADSDPAESDSALDADPDSDPDLDQKDADLADGDPDSDGTGCTCPLVTGLYCIDPLIQNPRDFQQLDVKLGSGCALNLKLTTSLQVVFSGDASCDAQGHEDLKALGCELSYRATTNSLLLYCGSSLYSFGPDFCPKPDGDLDADPDQDPDLNSDSDSGNDLDHDLGDTDLDADNTERDTDTIEIELTMCQKDDDCAAFDNCQSGVCRAGSCNLVSSFCNPGFACIEHGYCVQADGDLEVDIDGYCTDDTACNWGSYCKIFQGSSQGLCGQDCTAQTCSAGKSCNLERGRCEEKAICKSDSECPVCYTCNAQGTCVDGCCAARPCGDCLRCNDHICLPDPSCATDGDGPDCTQNSDCEAKYGAGRWFCNGNFTCEKLTPCFTDNDALTYCGVQNYCDNNECKQDCCTDATCAPAKSCLQTSDFCSYYGRCETTDSDPDPDEGGSGGCKTDAMCGPGLYCIVEYGLCNWDCQSNDMCTGGQVCSAHGQCETLDGDVESDLDPDLDTPIPCSSDLGCPATMFCNYDNGTCANNCGKCACNLKCSARGRCDLACTAGESGCGACLDGDTTDTDTNTGCTDDVSCGFTHYCNKLTGACLQDCLGDGNCQKGYSCLDHGRCGVYQLPCSSDVTCPRREYCTNSGVCGHDCVSSSECSGGKVCDARGHCTPSPGTSYYFPPCSSDVSCPAYSFCGADSACQSNCLPPNLLCASDSYCARSGNCLLLVEVDGDTDSDADLDLNEGGEVPVDGDEDIFESDFEFVACQNDCQCMHHTYCGLVPIGTGKGCSAMCLNDSNCLNNPSGQTCDARGFCSNTPEPFDPQCVLRNSNQTSTPCGSDADCPSYSYCAIDALNGNYCRLDCFNYPADPASTIACPANQTCTSRGRCQANSGKR